MLRRLDIHNVRNLREVHLRDIGAVSLIYGPNGSGKSSVLEAVHLLGMARSFRSGQPRTLINHEADQCVVHGELSFEGGMGGARVRSLGVSRRRSGELELKVGGASSPSVAELAQCLPLQVLDSASFELLAGPPAVRRRFLDWGVFHVEPSFLPLWRRFQRALRQRNAMLRRGTIDWREWRVWTEEVVHSGDALTALRSAYFDQLTPVFLEMRKRLMPEMPTLNCAFRPGWAAGVSLHDALEQGKESDVERGFTQVGPQRADVRFTVGRHPAVDVLSRGQQKLMACSLKLAQGQLMGELNGRVEASGFRPTRCLYLVDDLPAELDAVHLQFVCQALAEMGAQVFITAIDPQTVLSQWPLACDQIGMFHVEHGVITQTDLHPDV